MAFWRRQFASSCCSVVVGGKKMAGEKILIKQEPIKILSGPDAGSSTYSMRKDFGMPMTDEAYAKAIETQAAYKKAAEDYKSSASKSVSDAVGQAQSQLSAYDVKRPEEVTIWAGGDGDQQTAYSVPKDAAAEILGAMTENGYYHSAQHDDGSYGLAFGEYGKEGYEAMNSVVSDYASQLSTAQEASDIQKKGGEDAIFEAKMAAEAQILDQYNYILGLFNTQVSDMAADWEAKKAASSEAVISALTSGGVFASKVGRVV